MIYVEHWRRALERAGREESMRTEWETTTVIVDTQHVKDYQQQFDQQLNQQGKQGWELVSVVRDMNKLVAYLKRQRRMM